MWKVLNTLSRGRSANWLATIGADAKKVVYLDCARAKKWEERKVEHSKEVERRCCVVLRCMKL